VDWTRNILAAIGLVCLALIGLAAWIFYGMAKGAD
jgi:hypothetical protein